MHPIEHLRYVARTGGDVPQSLLTREAAYGLADLSYTPGELVMACRKLLQRHGVAGAMWTLAARVCVASDPHQAAMELVQQMKSDPTAGHVAKALRNLGPSKTKTSMAKTSIDKTGTVKTSMAKTSTDKTSTACLLGWPDLAADRLHECSNLEVRVLDAYGEGAGLARRLLSSAGAASGNGSTTDSGSDGTFSGLRTVEVPLTGMSQAIATSDVVLIEAAAAGPDAIVAATGSYAAAAVARSFGVDVWAVIGVGRALPAEMFEALLSHLASNSAGTGPLSSASQVPSWEAEEEVVPVSLATHLVRPDGLHALTTGPGEAMKSDCPLATELLVPLN